LYLVPSVKQLLAPTWSELEELAIGGATIYVSYSAGATEWHGGPPYGRLAPMLGIEHHLRAGLMEAIEDDTITFTLTRGFGSMAAGARLSFRAAGTAHSRSFLPVRPVSAEVLAVDGHGRPALLLRRVGSGTLVLCTYPIEHMAAASPGVNPEATSTLYGALADHAGVRRDIQVDDPRVASDVIVRADGTRFAWLVSQANQQLTIEPRLASGLTVALDAVTAVSPDGGGQVTIPPWGVAVFRLTDEGAS
jgi:hypothetical protein